MAANLAVHPNKKSRTTDPSFRTFTFLFHTWFQVPADMPEKIPVEEQVDNEQDGERKSGDIMVQDPVMTGDSHPRYPVPAPSAPGRQVEVEHEPGGQHGNESYQAGDIDKGINGDAFHTTSYGLLKCPVY